MTIGKQRRVNEGEIDLLPWYHHDSTEYTTSDKLFYGGWSSWTISGRWYDKKVYNLSKLR